MKTSLLLPISCFSLCLGVSVMNPASARAGTIAIYSNLGAGQSFNTAQGWEIDGGIATDQVIANAFMTSITATLSGVQLALGSIVGLDTMDVYLESDSGGAPGLIVTQLIQQGSIAAFTSPSGGGGLVTYTCAACPRLVAGTPYWLVAFESDPTTLIEWNWNSTGDAGTGGNFAYNNSGGLSGPWSEDTGDARGAFEVDAVTVPEPGAWWLLASGLAGVALMLRHLR